MIKGQQGGNFASNGYQQTIEEEMNSVNQPDSYPSQFYPNTNFVHPSIPEDSRQRRGLEMNPDTQNDDGNFKVTLPKIENLKQQWDQNKVVNIPNLFPTLQANTIHDFYFNQPNDWWDLILYPDPDFDYEQSAIDNPGYYHMYKAKSDDPSIPRREEHCRNINDNGGFSYIYRRTNDLSIQLHPYLELFQSKHFLDYISSITGYDDLEYSEKSTFVSNYESGHYNGPHTDGSNGRLAFVFHLSKDWKPEMGGLFMRLRS